MDEKEKMGKMNEEEKRCKNNSLARIAQPQGKTDTRCTLSLLSSGTESECKWQNLLCRQIASHTFALTKMKRF